jgi:hypothetical protein
LRLATLAVGAPDIRCVEPLAAALYRAVPSPAVSTTQPRKEIPVKRMMTVIAVTLAAASWTAQAADEKKPTAQQNKMTECNKEAGDKKGDERKAFMKTCLSSKKTAQQEKMKTCNKEAGDKKGDERKAFMKTCLSA